MKKTIISLMVATALATVMTVGAFAEATINDRFTIPGKGTVVPEGVSPGDLYDITVPTEVAWTLTKKTGEDAPVLQSAEYSITNNSAFGVKAQLESFKQVKTMILPKDAKFVLNLSGDISKANIIDYVYTDADKTPAVAEMDKPGTMQRNYANFAFTGSYTGDYPKVELNPTYSMVLKFSKK